MVKITLIFLLLLSAFSFGFGQQVGQKVSGTVISGETETPVTFCQIAIYSHGSTHPIKGAVTNDKGEFQISLDAGLYDLVVLMVGFENKEIARVEIKDKNIDFGTIILMPSTKQLEEVVVKGNKRDIVTGLEGLSIDAQLNNASAGGSVLDILRSAPSITISDEGTVMLRGSSANILINGRTSALSSDLEQIAANLVESIEIINNPNAKYDAQAASGIINIKLKKEQKEDTDGAAEFTIGTGYRMNSGIHLNHRSKALNLRLGYSYKRWPRTKHIAIQRELFSMDEKLEENRKEEKSDNEHTIDWGADYWFGKNKISYEGLFNREKENEREQVKTRIFQHQEWVSQGLRASHEIEDNYTVDNALAFERQFDDAAREFKALASYSLRNDWESGDLTTFSDVKKPEQITDRERSITNEKRSTLALKADYAQALLLGALNVGYKFTHRSIDDDYNYKVVDKKTGHYLNLVSISNRFVYKEQVHAAYLLYDFAEEKFKVSVGTRFEETDIKGEVMNNGASITKSYLNLFPSLQALYELNKAQSLKFTFSRRIERPKAKLLNPFPDITDSLNIKLGNPALAPEYIQSFELGHMIDLPAVNFTFNFYYRHVAGEIDYLLKIEDGVSYAQPANLNSSQIYGVEAINSASPFSWWRINASFSLFKTEVDGSNLNDDYVNKGVSWNAKLNSDFKLFYKLNLQMNASYLAPEVEVQGRNLAQYYIDMGLQRKFFHDKASIRISCSDVFNTLKKRSEIKGEDYRQIIEEKKETRIFLATLAYKL